MMSYTCSEKTDEKHFNVFCGGKKCSLLANTNHRVIHQSGDEGNGALMWCNSHTREKMVSNTIVESLCRHQTWVCP